MRLILHRIGGEQKLMYKSWAIQKHPIDLDQKFWERRAVDILDVDLDQYIPKLDDFLRLRPQAASATTTSA